MLYYQVVNMYHQPEGDYPRKKIWTWDIDTVSCQLD